MGSGQDNFNPYYEEGWHKGEYIIYENGIKKAETYKLIYRIEGDEWMAVKKGEKPPRLYYLVEE